MGALVKLGLTGGVGSGKSTVTGMCAMMGLRVLDADAISRSLTALGGAALPDIQNTFGKQAIAVDGSMDRTFVRNLVFSDPVAKQKLESIIHPLVLAQILKIQTDAQKAGDSILVMDIPLLVESKHWRARLDYVIVIDCDEATQLERVSIRSGWSPAQTQQVMATQAARAQRLASADTVICNQNISLTQLELKVRQSLRKFGL